MRCICRVHALATRAPSSSLAVEAPQSVSPSADNSSLSDAAIASELALRSSSGGKSQGARPYGTVRWVG